MGGRNTLSNMSFMKLKKLMNYKRVNKIPISPELFDAYKDARSKRIEVLSKKDRLSKEFLQRKNQGHKL